LGQSLQSWNTFDLGAVLVLNQTCWGASVTPVWAVVSGLGLFLKLLLVPFQGTLLALYSTAPLLSLLAYFTLYYIFFLPIGLALLSPALSIFWGGWALFGLIALGSVFWSLHSALVSEVDIKQILAVSSVVNLTLLVLVLS